MMAQVPGRLLASSALLLFCAAPARAADADPLLARAMSCGLADAELATLPAALAAADPASFSKPAERHGAPTFDVFALHKPIVAFDRSVDRVVLQPGRVLALLPIAVKDAVERSYALKPADAPYSPDERVMGDGRRLVAYTLEGTRYAGQVFVGCQYERQAAASWGADDGGLSALLR